MSAAATTSDTDGTGNAVTQILRRVIQSYRRRDYAAKRLAEVAGTSHRTAEDWLQDRTLPASAETLLRLAAEHPELQAAVNAHIERLRFANEMKIASEKPMLRWTGKILLAVCRGIDLCTSAIDRGNSWLTIAACRLARRRS